MKIKYSAVMAGLQLEMREVLKQADLLWKENNEELVVTAATDGEHSAGSLHYYGYAVDLRTRYFGADDSRKIAIELQKRLNKDYTVIFEGDHIHVQYNIHKMNG